MKSRWRPTVGTIFKATNLLRLIIVRDLFHLIVTLTFQKAKLKKIVLERAL